MKKTFKINNKTIGDDKETFIIAEAGINHGGDFKIAKKMVDKAAEIGADAITFQHIDAQDYNLKPQDVEYWNKLRLRDSEIEFLISKAKKKSLISTACVINQQDLDLIVNAGADFIKIVSGDITCHPFITSCALTDLPIFMSSGAANLEEVKSAVDVISKKGNEKIVIYHTCTNYPTPSDEVNLDIIDLFKREFEYPIGYCDHTSGYFVPLLAASKGICVLEKHLSLDVTKKGPDYEVSLEPNDFKKMRLRIKEINVIRGEQRKILLDSEKTNYLQRRRSIVSNKIISKGETITEDDLTYKKPGYGIQGDHLNDILGKWTIKEIKKNEVITKDMVES